MSPMKIYRVFPLVASAVLAMALDPADYAVDASAFAADKADLWSNHPVDADQWVLSHNALRTEIQEMSDALGDMATRTKTDNAQTLPGWSVQTVQDWWSAHTAHVSEHCVAEDAVLKPILSERFAVPKEVNALHRQLDNLQRNVDRAVKNLKATDPSSLQTLRTALSSYQKTMSTHFDVEEKKTLPLMRSFFSPDEIQPVQKKMLEDCADTTIGAVIYGMDPAGARFQSEFMKQRSIPFFVWHLAFKKRLKLYKNEMVAKVEAIRSGKEPVKSSGSWFGGGSKLARPPVIKA